MNRDGQTLRHDARLCLHAPPLSYSEYPTTKVEADGVCVTGDKDKKDVAYSLCVNILGEETFVDCD